MSVPMTAPWLEERRTAVYYVYDSADGLLYVGMSINPVARANGHAHKTWWQAAARIEIEWYEKRSDAEEAERHAIETRNPTFNGSHTVRVLPNPTPIIVADDERANLLTGHAAQLVNIRESAVQRCVELGWIVPVMRISPGSSRGFRWFSAEAMEEFRRRWEAGEYAAAFPGTHKS